jgi:signal transduction histidine kinase
MAADRSAASASPLDSTGEPDASSPSDDPGSPDAQKEPARKALLQGALQSAKKLSIVQFLVMTYLIFAGVQAGRTWIGVGAFLIGIVGMLLRLRLAMQYADKPVLTDVEMTLIERRFEMCVLVIGLGWGISNLTIYPVIASTMHGQMYVTVLLGALLISMLWTSLVGRSFQWYLGVQMVTLVSAHALVAESRNLLLAVFLLALSWMLFRGSLGVLTVTRGWQELVIDNERERERAATAERTALENARQAAATAEQRAVETQRVFVAKMSHEIRTPVQLITAVLEAVELDGELSERNAARLRAAGQTLIREMNQLSAYVEAGKTFANPVRVMVPLRAMIEEVTVMYQMECEAKGIRIDVTSDDATVLTLETELRTAVQNMIGNAVKYTQSGAVQVECAVRGEGDQTKLVVTVQDTGPGLAGVEKDRLFEPFYRGTATSNTDGMGLGLSIVRSMADKLGGTATLVDGDEIGAVAVLSCPVQVSPQSNPMPRGALS